MNVLLIDTGYDIYELDEPLGIEQLDGYIQHTFGNKIGLTTEWLVENPNFELKDEYDLVLVSGNIYDDGKMNKVIDFFSKAHSQPQVVIGGVAATLSAKSILNNFPTAICIIGEGEETITSIINNMLSGKFEKAILENEIPNIAFVDSNNVIQRSSRKEVALSEIHSLPNRKYLKYTLDNNGLARMEWSRGCDWNRCSFCIVRWKYAGSKRREFLESRVQNDLEVVLRANATRVYFTDEEFFPSSDLNTMYHKLDFLNKVKLTSNNFFEYVASTSTRSILYYYQKDTSFWKQVYEVGFKRLFVGIESLSESQLKRYCKGCTKEENLEALKILSDAGIEVDVGFIMFDPFLSLKELQENVLSIVNSPLNLMTSRLSKKMRIIENTVCFEQLGQLDQVGMFSPDGFDYEWEFQDSNIAEIHKSIVAYEKNKLEEMYNLQSKIRSCVNSEEDVLRLIVLRQNLLKDLLSLLFEERYT